MYNELYAAWQLETEYSELGRLPSDFYTRLVDYLQRLGEAGKAQSEKNLKASLIGREASNAKHMVEELVATRYHKLIQLLLAKQEVPTEVTVSEEVHLCSNLSASTEAYTRFAASLLAGQAVAITPAPAVQVEALKPENEKNDAKPALAAATSAPVALSVPVTTHKRVAVRFLKTVPAIIGSDMKTYGPFIVEDVASVPESNAKILIRQGLAKLVELP
jgi:DNA replication initiation complex subunit (GINS family)